jgi:2-aminoadipate transaminase
MAFSMARRMEVLRASEIRELLKITGRPEVISFAGGLPAPETFPVREMGEAVERLLAEHGAAAMQYSTTEGHPPLRAKIADRTNATAGTRFTAEDVLITSGSQQGLDLTGKIFLDDGDDVLCESPTYLGAINAFRAYGPRFVEVPTDDDGMITQELDERVRRCPRAKLIYVVPDFQNPTGRCWSVERRRGLLDVARRHGLPVIEDAPYRELRFEGKSRPPLVALDADDLVVHLGTFSKIFAPGLRVAWLVAPRALLDKYVLVKQGADLHTSTFTQMAIDTYLDRFDIDAAIGRIRALYRTRRDLMVRAMEASFPPEVSFTRPAGGLFLWAELAKGVNARALLDRSLGRDVAFVPGGSFFPNGGHENTMRLNYSNMPADRIEEGIRRLAAMLAEARSGEPAAVAS